MKVSVSSFVGFVAASGTDRVTKVAEAKKPYDPRTDYYKRLRGLVTEALLTENIRLLDQVPDVPPQKQRAYEACIRGLRLWMKKNDFSVIAPGASSIWTSGDLEVAVNPELLIQVGPDRLQVKLYMKVNKLTTIGRQAYFHIMREAGDGLDARPGLLDLRRSRLLTEPKKPEGLEQLLDAEAAAFATLWKALNRPAA